MHLTFFLLVTKSTHAPPPPSLQQDIFYVKVGVSKNSKQLFLSVTYSKLIRGGVGPTKAQWHHHMRHTMARDTEFRTFIISHFGMFW